VTDRALAEILRQHAETGAYRGHIIRAHPDALDVLRATSARPQPRPVWNPDPMAYLLALDLVVDDGLPPRGWALVRVEYQAAPEPVWTRRLETVVATGCIDVATAAAAEWGRGLPKHWPDG
jgi:hypothetical protein